VARLLRLLVNAKILLVVLVVTYGVRAAGIVQTYSQLVPQSRVPTFPVQAGTVYDFAAPSSANDCATVAEACVTVVMVVHALRMVSVTVLDLEAMAVPSGVVPVIVMVCTAAMASVTEAFARVHVLVDATHARAAESLVGIVAA